VRYTIEMGSGVMTHIPSFIKAGSVIQKLMVGDSQIHRQHGDIISLLLFSENRESRPKIGCDVVDWIQLVKNVALVNAVMILRAP
jgi:hypothetical protein